MADEAATRLKPIYFNRRSPSSRTTATVNRPLRGRACRDALLHTDWNPTNVITGKLVRIVDWG